MPRVEKDDTGHPVFIHACTSATRRTILRLGTEGWQWTGDDTLHPSVHCTSCGTHGWWRGGGWVPC
jgi:hypothetical protein